VSEIRLVPFAAAHLEGVTALIADADTLRFTRLPEPPPPDFAPRWLARYEQARRDGTQDGFAAIDADGRFVGLGLAPKIDRAGREVELGYIVAAQERGRGVATEILRRLTEWALVELGALRVYLLIDVENVASERVAARCGYVREGVMRSTHVKQGRRADTALWSRLPSDPG